MKMQINGEIVRNGYEDLLVSADLAPAIIKFNARSRCVRLYNLDSLTVGKCSRYPFSRRMDEPQSQCRRFGETPTTLAKNHTTLPLSYGL